VGHTKVRCKEPLVEDDAGDTGNNGGGDMGNHGYGGQDGFGSAPAGNDGWS
jgi:hypothetical protein